MRVHDSSKDILFFNSRCFFNGSCSTGFTRGMEGGSPRLPAGSRIFLPSFDRAGALILWRMAYADGWMICAAKSASEFRFFSEIVVLGGDATAVFSDQLWFHLRFSCRLGLP